MIQVLSASRSEKVVVVKAHHANRRSATATAVPWHCHGNDPMPLPPCHHPLGWQVAVEGGSGDDAADLGTLND